MNCFRRIIIFSPLRRQPLRRALSRKPKVDKKREIGLLHQTLEKLKSALVVQKTSDTIQPAPENITKDNFFKKLDEPIRFIFKVPFIQSLYIYWLEKEGRSLQDSTKDKFHFVFLGELAFYGKLGIETFEKLTITIYPDITDLPDYRENLIILHHLITRNRGHIEENLYQLERDRKKDEDSENAHAIAPHSLTTKNYYKYIDLNVRPLFKFEVFQKVFTRWLRMEELKIEECFEAHYHNLFVEELLYYYDQGEGFLRSIVKNTYVSRDGEKLNDEELNVIFMLVQTFDSILDETVKKIKNSQGDLKEIDKKQFLNHGYDFGMILYYMATKDTFNALMTARGLVIDTASKIWEKKQKHKQEKEKDKSD